MPASTHPDPQRRAYIDLVETALFAGNVLRYELRELGSVSDPRRVLPLPLEAGRRRHRLDCESGRVSLDVGQLGHLCASVRDLSSREHVSVALRVVLVADAVTELMEVIRGWMDAKWLSNLIKMMNVTN